MKGNLLVILLGVLMVISIFTACGDDTPNKEEAVTLTAEEMVNRLNDASENNWEYVGDRDFGYTSPDGEKYYYQTGNVYYCEAAGYFNSAQWMKQDKKSQREFDEMMSELQFQAKEIERYTGDPCEIVLYKGDDPICIVDAKHTIYDYVNGMQDSTDYVTIDKAIEAINKKTTIGSWQVPNDFKKTKALYLKLNRETMDMLLDKGLDESASGIKGPAKEGCQWVESVTGIDGIVVKIFSPYKEKSGCLVTAE